MKKGIVTAFVSLFIVLVVIYGVISFYYTAHLFPGTTVNGVDVGNVDYQDLGQQLELSNMNAHFTGRDGLDLSVPMSAFGISIDAAKAVEDLKAVQNALLWPFHGERSYTIIPAVSLNASDFSVAMDVLPLLYNDNAVSPVDASIEYDNETHKYYVKPSILGNEIDEAKFVNTCFSAFSRGVYDVDLDSSECYINPKHTEKDAMFQTLVDNLNAYSDMKIVYHIGNDTVEYSFDELRELLSIGADLNVSLSQNAVEEFVKAFADKHQTYGKSQLFTTVDGYVLNLPNGDNYGWELDIEAESAKLYEELATGGAVDREPVWKHKGTVFGDNDYGSYYVEVNITDQKVYVVSGNEILLETDCVTGNLAHNTVTNSGIFSIFYHGRDATLRGDNYESFVYYWMPFDHGIGLHDATWRRVFGGSIYKTSGSHGCVNLPLAKAKEIYELTYYGCPVICYELTDTYIVSRPSESEIAPEAGFVSSQQSDWAAGVEEMRTAQVLKSNEFTYYGTLRIPSVGLTVPLYVGDLYDGAYSQKIVDAKNSACLLSTGTGPLVVADHKNHGFSAIRNLNVGDTIYIDVENGIMSYIVSEVDPNGHNIGDVIDSSNQSIFAGDSSDLNLYTCNENWQNVTIVKCDFRF